MDYNDTQVKKLPLVPIKKKPLGDDAEQRYWKSFQEIYTSNCPQTIRQTCSNQNTKNLIAYTDGQQVNIFSSSQQKITKTFARFKAPVQSIAFRKDGQLLAAGLETGDINIYNLKTKLPLRIFKNFKKSVHAISFNPINFEHLFGASDEGIVKLFDVTAESVVRSIPKAHNDFIRSIAPLGTDEFHLLTSSYDKTIKLFDLRSEDNNPVMTFEVNDPVEGIAVQLGTQNFVSVSGTNTTLWDIRRQDYIQNITVNQKTVTGVRYGLGYDGPRFITYSLDHQFKIIRPDIMQVTFQRKFDNPLVAADISSEGNTIILGDTEGNIIVNQRNNKANGDLQADKEEELIPQYLKENPYLKKRIRNFQFYNRGIYQNQNKYDVKVSSTTRAKLGHYDKLLVQFKYKESLIKAIQEKQSQTFMSLIEEFIYRDALSVALNKLTDEELDQVVEFSLRKLINPKYQEACLVIIQKLIDLNPQRLLARHPEIAEHFDQEQSLEKSLMQLQGCLDLLMQENH